MRRHFGALRYAVSVIIPLLVRHRRRPVIFSRFSGMGDIICSVPAARELMKRHPGSAFVYNCHPDFVTVPRLAGIADCTTSFESIGLVGYWYRFLLAGFYHFAHGDEMQDRGAQEPMVVEFLRQFDLPITEEHPRLPVEEVVRKRALQILADKGLSPDALILIHPGPSWPVREWPLANWARLVEELHRRGFTNIGQLGVSRYLDFGKVDLPIVPKVKSLVNAVTVEECIAVISQAKLFIGIDSGLLHIAATVGAPSVGIFGMTLPQFRFSKRFREGFVVADVDCAGCEHRKPRLHWITGCPFDIKCMRTLDVGHVLTACLSVLARTGEK